VRLTARFTADKFFFQGGTTMKEVTIYTDGACSGNPGPGGWGAVLTYKDKQKTAFGYEPHTTNNRMELVAVIESLKLLNQPCHVQVYSDSAYLVNCFNNNWIEGWQKNGWRTSKNQPVENRELWEALLELMKIHQVEYFKVKGHSHVTLNEMADRLAREAIKRHRS
jgi:ribonuclease HI